MFLRVRECDVKRRRCHPRRSSGGGVNLEDGADGTRGKRGERRSTWSDQEQLSIRDTRESRAAVGEQNRAGNVSCGTRDARVH